MGRPLHCDHCLVSSRRLRLAATVLAAAPVTLLAILLASRSEALTHRFSAVSHVSEAGHRLALLLAVLCCVQVGVTVCMGLAAKQLDVPARFRRVAGWLLVITLSAILVVGLVRVGNPVRCRRPRLPLVHRPGRGRRSRRSEQPPDQLRWQRAHRRLALCLADRARPSVARHRRRELRA